MSLKILMCIPDKTHDSTSLHQVQGNQLGMEQVLATLH